MFKTHKRQRNSLIGLLAIVASVMLVSSVLSPPSHTPAFASTQHNLTADCSTNSFSNSINVSAVDTLVITVGNCSSLNTGLSDSPFTWWSTNDLDQNGALLNGSTTITFTFDGSRGGSIRLQGPAQWALQVGVLNPPSAPGAISATIENQQTTLTWGASSFGSNAYYEVEQSIDNSTWAPVSGTCSGQVATSANLSGCTVTNLTNGTPYYFRIRGQDIGGAGAWTTLSSPVTPSLPPPAPTGVSGVAGNAQVTLSWTAPTMDSSYAAITGYKIEVDDGNGWVTSIANTASTNTTAVVTDGPQDSFGLTTLKNGSSYSFRVSAINGAGPGSASTASGTVIPFTVPGMVFEGDIAGSLFSGTTDTLTLTWQAPPDNPFQSVKGDGGRPITRYEVEFAPDPSGGQPNWSAPTGGTCTSQNLSSTNCTISGLTQGDSYVFQIRAFNEAGWGPYSNASNPIPVPGPASAPPNLSATAGDGQVTLVWGLPTSLGGHDSSSGLSYDIEQSNDNGASWVTASSVVIPGSGPGGPGGMLVPGMPSASLPSSSTDTITGLTNGTTYSFRVSAVTSYGNGLWSTINSVTPSTTPGAPAAVTATRGDTEVLLSWSAPLSDGGSPITDYRYEVSSNGGNSYSTAVAVGSNATSVTVSSLTNGTSYVFRVTAENANGLGTQSTVSNSATPVALPATPTGLSATKGNGQVVLSWTPGASVGTSLTGHLVEVSTDSGTNWSTAIADTGSTSGSATVTGLTNGLSYLFRVSGISSAGTGLPLTLGSAVIPSTIPSPATGLAATLGDQQVTLSWSAGANGGSAITGYQVEKNDGSGWTVVTANTNSASTTYTVSNLSNGTAYNFRVTPINANGSSASPSGSLQSSVTPVAAPGVPPAPTALAGAGSATVSVTAGTGGPPSSYTVTASPGNGTCTVSGVSGSCTITGLTAGTAYTFSATAANPVGTSAASSSSTAVTPTAATNLSGSNRPSQSGRTPALQVPVVIPGTAPNAVALPPGRINASNQTATPPSSAAPGPVAPSQGALAPPREPVAIIGGRETAISTETTGPTDITLRAGSLRVGISVNQESGAVRTGAGGTTELAVTKGSATRLQGAGLQPGGVVQVFLPGAGSNADPLSTIPVSADGSFQGEATFATSLQAEPIPIGPNTLQLVSVDENGDQVVLEMAVNIAQGLPAPELNRVDGEIPTVTPGQTLGMSAGEPVSVNVSALEEQKLAVVEGDGWTMAVAIGESNGAVTPTDSGALVTLVRDEAAQVSGSGFMAGTRADVWLFSEPTLLGTVTVDENGEFSGAVNIDGRLITPGNHTLQLQGVGEDGFVKAANLGVTVEDGSASSAEQSVHAGGMLLWWSLASLIVLMVILLIALYSRKRREP